MWADDAAVAGFFEDLPVLAFILAGVMILVLSSVWVSSSDARERLESELELEAEELVRSILDDIREFDSMLPTVHHIEGMDLADAALDTSWGHEYSVSIVELYPDARLILSERNGSFDGVTVTGSSSALLNATGDLGEVVVLEVRAIVWQI